MKNALFHIIQPERPKLLYSLERFEKQYLTITKRKIIMQIIWDVEKNSKKPLSLSPLKNSKMNRDAEYIERYRNVTFAFEFFSTR